MNVLKGLGGAAALFIAFFALHIVGGASGQRWLFNMAVVLIYLSATAFPAIAVMLARLSIREPDGRALLYFSLLPASVLTSSALWAASGRTFAVWQPPLAVGLVLISTAVLSVIPELARMSKGDGPAKHAAL